MAASDDSPGAEKPHAMPDQQPRWAEPIFLAGLVVGAALLMAGILCQAFQLIALTISALVICSGLGIIFGAFGSTAVIEYKGVVIAGVAAVSIALLLVVDWLMGDSLLKLEIDGDVRDARLELLGDTTFPGANHGQRYEFYIVGRTISTKRERLTLVVTPPPPPHGEEGPKKDLSIEFECIPSAALTRFVGSGQTLQWRYDTDREVLTGVDGKVIRSGPCVEKREEAPRFSWWNPTGIAHAEETEAIGRVDAEPQVEQLLRDLESESAVVRRDGRAQLAAVGVDAIAPMMRYWREHPESYRVSLGVSVALSQFLDEHKADRASVSTRLTDDDLQLLATAAGSPDRTLRIYASEFLYDLGDVRVVPIAEKLFAGASDDGRYNLLVVLQGAVPHLDAEQRRTLAAVLEKWEAEVGPRTQKLIATVRTELAA